MIIQPKSDEEILSTRAVMLQLRPHIAPGDYLPRVRRMMNTGFHLAAVVEDETVRAVAGYRYLDMLYSGKMLYLDDLVTDSEARSGGHGRELITWLQREAVANGCAEIHLDSRVDRAAAHRFYFRERFSILGFHFAKKL